MPSSDALIVVEDWISEHFFTTDARKESFQKLVLDRRKQDHDPERVLSQRCEVAVAEEQGLGGLQEQEQGHARATPQKSLSLYPCHHDPSGHSPRGLTQPPW